MNLTPKDDNYDLALKYLRINIKNADFRDGQWRAINQIVNLKKRMLVVQRTGWGKSSVYFISTKILRQLKFGPTLIISPLLSLMRNQVDYAKKLKLKVETINSSNTNDHESIKEKVLTKKIDALLISPERLSNEDFVREILTPIANKIGLLVVDEAHCISDWGHDFRPDYKRINNIIRQLPQGIPILGTTATANNRVIEDIETQIDGIGVERGDLMRESLSLQNINLPRKSNRLGWLAENIPTLEGTGIIYVLTVRDAIDVHLWLKKNNIKSIAYHGSLDSNLREDIESKFLNNGIKVLVATKALGMGFDKPDVHFIIHYQMPASVIQYYQEVGRAGRSIKKAYGILFSGSEDDDIHSYFRNTAFPSSKEVNELLDTIKKYDGLTRSEIISKANMREGKIEKILKQLLTDSPSSIAIDCKKYFKTPLPYIRMDEHINKILNQRKLEWGEMQNYFSESKVCLMKVLGKSLDDNKIQNCGKCYICLNDKILPDSVSKEIIISANEFLQYTDFIIKPRIQIPLGLFNLHPFKGRIPPELRPDDARCLSRWRDGGLGDSVYDGKNAGTFSEELLEATIKMIKRWDIKIDWITCVPSMNHPDLVPEFAKKLSGKLQVPFISVIDKVRSNELQKNQENSFHQAKNLDGVFEINNNKLSSAPNGGNKNHLPVLLIDDIVDSNWTFTICSALLKHASVEKVYPLALSSTGPS